MQPNNPVGADCLETSVVLLRLLASAQLERYTESVFNSMINCQSNLKNPLPSPHFPLPTPQRRVWGVESPKSQRLSDKIGNNSQF